MQTSDRLTTARYAQRAAFSLAILCIALGSGCDDNKQTRRESLGSIEGPEVVEALVGDDAVVTVSVTSTGATLMEMVAFASQDADAVEWQGLTTEEGFEGLEELGESESSGTHQFRWAPKENPQSFVANIRYRCLKETTTTNVVTNVVFRDQNDHNREVVAGVTTFIRCIAPMGTGGGGSGAGGGGANGGGGAGPGDPLAFDLYGNSAAPTVDGNCIDTTGSSAAVRFQAPMATDAPTTVDFTATFTPHPAGGANHLRFGPFVGNNMPPVAVTNNAYEMFVLEGFVTGYSLRVLGPEGTPQEQQSGIDAGQLTADFSCTFNPVAETTQCTMNVGGMGEVANVTNTTMGAPAGDLVGLDLRGVRLCFNSADPW